MSNQPIVRRILFLSLALGTVAVVVACSDPENRIPTAPGAPGFTGAEIAGPPNIAPGQSVQLTANARFTDGTVKAVGPSTVRWLGTGSSLLSVTASGLATAGQTRGEAIVTVDVTLNGVRRSASRSIAVMPDDTFRVVGSVRDSEVPALTIGGARVEVTSGDPATFTDSNGQYRLYGVPQSADIRVTAPGYQTETRTVTLAANSTQDFRMALDGPRAGFSGDYTLSIDVMDACSGFLPLATSLRNRTYDATVIQNTSTVDVHLTEPRFRLNGINRGNRFTGQAKPGGASFNLGWYDSYYYPFYGPNSYPNVAEALGDGTFLVTSGTVTMVGSATTASGVLSGGIAQWDSRFPGTSSRLLGQCYGAVRLSLTHK